MTPTLRRVRVLIGCCACIFGALAILWARAPRPASTEMRDAVASPMSATLAGTVRAPALDAGYFARTSLPAAAEAERVGDAVRNLEFSVLDASLLRQELHSLRLRARTQPQMNVDRREGDASVRDDIRRFPWKLAQLTRVARGRFDDLRSLTPRDARDERLRDAALRLSGEAGLLVADARAASLEFAGSEGAIAMGLEQSLREVDQRARDLMSEAERLVARIED